MKLTKELKITHKHANYIQFDFKYFFFVFDRNIFESKKKTSL